MNRLKDSLTCQICNLVYDKPVKLPCSKTICKSHLYDSNGILNSTFECKFCPSKKHPIPLKGFQTNFNIQHQIAANFYLTEYEQTIKKNSEIFFQTLKSTYDQTFSCIYDRITDHCNSLKRQIDLQKKQLKVTIDKAAEKLLEKINHHELLCKLELSKQETVSIDKYKLELESCFRGSHVRIEEIQQIEDKVKKLMALREKSIASQLEYFVFEPALINENCKLFGKLIEKVKLVIGKIDGSLWFQDLNEANSNSVMLINKNFCDLRCMIFSLDRQKLITGDWNNAICVWDFKNGKTFQLLRTLKTREEITGRTRNLKDFTNSLICLVNTIQQNTILSGSTDRLIRLWDIETGELKKFYSGHTRSIKCLEVLSKRFFASGSNDTTIKIWHLKTGKCVKTLAEHENSVWCLKKLNDHQFSSGSQDQSIKIWSSFGNEIKCVKTFHVDFGIITRLEMIESLNFLVSSSMVIHVWDLNTYQCVWRLTPNENSKVRYFQILPNNRIISSQKNNTLEIFCLNTGKSLRVLKDIEANFIETIV